MGLHIVIYGNPVDGFRYHGPFKTADDATRWASEEIDDTWWIAPLQGTDQIDD